MINELNNLKWRTKLVLMSITVLLLVANLVLLQKLDEHVSIWNRFTYNDWVALYKLNKEGSLKNIEDIMNVYEWKNTDFKDFLIINHK